MAVEFLKGKRDVRSRALACLEAVLVSLGHQQVTMRFRLKFSQKSLLHVFRKMTPDGDGTYLVELCSVEPLFLESGTSFVYVMWAGMFKLLRHIAIPSATFLLSSSS